MGWEAEKSEVMPTTQGFKVSVNTCDSGEFLSAIQNNCGLLNSCNLLAKAKGISPSDTLFNENSP